MSETVILSFLLFRHLLLLLSLLHLCDPRSGYGGALSVYFGLSAGLQQLHVSHFSLGLSDNEFGFGDSRNMAGIKVGASYSLSDSAYFGLNYLKFENLRSDAQYTNVGSGFSSGEWFQAEVGVKF